MGQSGFIYIVFFNACVSPRKNNKNLKNTLYVFAFEGKL